MAMPKSAPVQLWLGLLKLCAWLDGRLKAAIPWRRHSWPARLLFYVLGAVLIISFAVFSSLTTKLTQQHGIITAGHNSRGSKHSSGFHRALFDTHNRHGALAYDASRDYTLPAFRSDESDVERSVMDVITDHPRLFATADSWNGLPKLITTDPYLKKWDTTIMSKASTFYDEPPTNYSIDGGLYGSGVLDVAREVQLRIKHWAYAYQVSGDSKWVDRTWKEILVASGNSTQYFGVEGDNWNSNHWLDVGEFIVAFSYAYDWLYDAWTATQREAILWSIISLGLQKGTEAYDEDAWFLSVHGNWNCVTNGGMIIGSLAIYHEDPTGTAAQLLPLAIANSKEFCGGAVQPDGTWPETSDYWYFGMQGYAQTASALLSATGTSSGTLSINPAYQKTGDYHIYVTGMNGRFDYGDCGPNKYTATANALLFFGNQYNIPHLVLYQRDQNDAADPLSMFWYSTEVTGDWFMGLPLDQNFPSLNNSWVSMRSSWTDPRGVFVGMKAGRLTGHQTHGDLDAGDFVLDALGQRWAGELCQDNYLATGYFSSEAQDSQRWLYYRCRTEGQNTLLYDSSNQLVDAVPTANIFGTTGTVQTLNGQQPGGPDTAYWIADLSATIGGTSYKRGLRMLSRRRQVLIQDELSNAVATSQWRMHTNATIALSAKGQVATLSLNGETMHVRLQSPSMASFQILEAVRLSSDPALPEGESDLPNPGVSVLAIDLEAGTQTVVIVFTPLERNGRVFERLPNVVPLRNWNLDSHS